MKLEKAELLERIRTFIGERTDDEALSLIEDVTDTITAPTDGEDWEARYKENDAAWRERYKARFFEAIDEAVEAVEELTDEDGKGDTIENLFTHEH